jgi:hypothetical protein
MAAPGIAKATFEATDDAFGQTLGGMFDIPYQNIVENFEEDCTLGASSTETGEMDTTPDTPWDPFSGW